MTLPLYPGPISLSQVNTEMNLNVHGYLPIHSSYVLALTGGLQNMGSLFGKSRSTGVIDISSGQGSWTVPIGVISVYFAVRGARGGNGGSDVYAGQVGWDGDLIYGYASVTAGTVYTYFCGNPGTNGSNGRSGTHGKGGSTISPAATGSINFSGGNGGDAGTYSKSNSGGGAGGGGASGIFNGVTPIAIAGGGGGGAGAGHQGGIKNPRGGTSGFTYGGTGEGGANADFGGCGGGGGGSPQGGRGGYGVQQDYFGYPGTSGQSTVPTGVSYAAGGQNNLAPRIYIVW